MVVVAAVFVLDLVVSLVGAAVYLERARAGGTTLRSLDPSELDIDSLRALHADADRAAWFAGHPAFRVAAAVSPDLEAVGVLARGAAAVSEPTLALVQSLSPNEGPELLVDGRVDLARLEAAGGQARRLEKEVSAWQVDIAGARSPWSGRLRAALHDIREDLEELGPSVAKAASALAILPAALGGDGDRTYLLTFQSPSEARGGGGLIGVVAELHAVDGSLDLGAVRSVRELARKMRGRVAAPSWFERTYGPLLALEDPRNVNVSPSFPITARVLLRMYRRALGVEAAGVLSTDPIAVGALTEVTGPLTAEGWAVAITEDNVRRVLLHDVYRHFHFREHAQNAYFGNLIDSLWSSLTSGEIDPFELADPVARSAAKQHLKINLQDPTEQQAIESVGAEGAFADEKGPQMIFNNNLSANKIDFFLHREVASTVRLREDSSATVRVDVTLDNRIEKLERNVIARPGVQRSLDLGLNRMSLGVIMPPGSTDVGMFVDGRALTPTVGLDAGHPVAFTALDVAAGGRTRVTITYRWPEAVADGRFRMTLMPHAAARPDRALLRVLGTDGRSLLQREEVLKEPLRLDVPA